MPYSTYALNANLNWWRGNAATTLPPAHWISLHTADPGLSGSAAEVVGNGYTREGDTVANFGWGAPVVVGDDIQVSNLEAVTFGPCTTASWGFVTHFGVFTASTGLTNFLGWGLLDDPRTVNVGDTYTAPIGTLHVNQR